MNQVGSRVEDRRIRLGLAQDELCAKLAQVTGGAWVADRRDIYRIEKARRTVTDLEVLALSLALGCPVVWLLVGEPPEPVVFQKSDDNARA
ncbi:hypothetical protein CCAX7_61810 [Capsulimonas corticalis]|uniref:Uncharacterized protein n=1 Tax=Capsulimonas corticalis TaxID=2219043 RepID=A0A402CWG5_9BACT|nr:helix-turn-helix transcriptional regulator [Capsulimonas corticalis]BDI34130.1 hypothetical protein CCAX7_61810 [Capsulimonas corticalis]